MVGATLRFENAFDGNAPCAGFDPVDAGVADAKMFEPKTAGAAVRYMSIGLFTMLLDCEASSLPLCIVGEFLLQRHQLWH